MKPAETSRTLVVNDTPGRSVFQTSGLQGLIFCIEFTGACQARFISHKPNNDLGPGIGFRLIFTI